MNGFVSFCFNIMKNLKMGLSSYLFTTVYLYIQ